MTTLMASVFLDNFKLQLTTYVKVYKLHKPKFCHKKRAEQIAEQKRKTFCSSHNSTSGGYLNTNQLYDVKLVKASKMCKYDKGTPTADDRAEENRINISLVADAGKVPLDASMGCGRGLVAEVKECLFKWWIPVRML